MSATATSRYICLAWRTLVVTEDCPQAGLSGKYLTDDRQWQVNAGQRSQRCLLRVGSVLLDG